MSYSVSEINGVKIYNLSAGKTLPQFMEESYKNHQSLRYNQEFRRRIELIQDFDFPVSSSQVNITEDQRFIVATGVYPPTIKIFDTTELSMKCLRGIDSEIVKFCLLTDDYTKMAFACMDRNIEFHAQYGKHYKVRIPKQPRDIKYNPFTCDLLIGASSNEIYRISLDEGQFLQPFEAAASFINVLDYNKQLNILISGGNNGIVEYWDYRQRKKINSKILNNGSEITEIKTDASSGLLYGVGSVDGTVRIYDVRHENSLIDIKHHYKLPINTINFHGRSRTILSSSKKVIKINNRETGQLFTNLEPSAEINQFELCQNSGLILIASGEPRIGSYFIPQLDNAPKWCTFLENITEELEEEQTTRVYDEFKFLSYEDLEKLNCTNLIGTKMLKQHLHGYIMHMKLYLKLKEKYDPFSFEEYKKQLINKQITAQTQSRVTINKNKPKVNQEFLEEIQKKKKENNLKKYDPTAILSDDRFKSMFQDEIFLIDKSSKEYLLAHPSEKAQRNINKQDKSDDEYQPEEIPEIEQQNKQEIIQNYQINDDDDNNMNEYLKLEKQQEKKEKLLTLKNKKIKKDLQSKRISKQIAFENKLKKSSAKID